MGLGRDIGGSMRTLRGGVVALGMLLTSAGVSSCYDSGSGTAPPAKAFYFPVGLAVSAGGNVLYAINSDFDLQWNGGTLQSYDLSLIRRHVVTAIANPADPSLPLVEAAPQDPAACPSNPPATAPDGTRQPIGETCAPPVDSAFYVRDSVIVGAFATDLQRSPSNPNRDFDRLFAPIRGEASLTWADIAKDDANVAPPSDPAAAYAPFVIDCGVRTDGRCSALHHAGVDPNEPGNTRHITMPGEPFGMAFSEDAESIVVTHQNDTKTSLFSSGLSVNGAATSPSIQFIANDLPIGGTSISPIPHDPDAFPPCTAGAPGCSVLPRPAYVQTTRFAPQLDLLRFYSDEGAAGSSSLHRPFLVNEGKIAITLSPSGVDSRAVVIDESPRIACKDKAGSSADAKKECARLPARVFIANRSPAAVLIGEVGGATSAIDSTYNADRISLYQTVPLSQGPSKIYLAPIVDKDGRYSLRLFIVCFDSATLFIYDPDLGQIENVIRLDSGPFTMAFDPFSMEDAALHKLVPMDARATDIALRQYRFAYVASFTKSFVQILDLDNARDSKDTFEKVVFTLGTPTIPKGAR